VLTRRKALLLGLGVPVSVSCWSLAPGEFWNDKNPSAWSEKELHRLLNRSPWAKQGILSMIEGPGSTLGDLNKPTGPGGQSRTPGSPPMQAPSMGETGASGTPGFNVLVRWESAAPVREAARQPVPAEAAQYYIVSVSGMPAIGHGSDEAGTAEAPDTAKRMEEQLKETTELLRKGKDPVRPARLNIIEQTGRRAALFFFPREPQPITLEDKEVTFATSIGPGRLRVRFILKEMLYKGHLEL
jgi:hypothetical protein